MGLNYYAIFPVLYVIASAVSADLEEILDLSDGIFWIVI
jgi:hypothetical protein